jgi:hypothetical protein
MMGFMCDEVIEILFDLLEEHRNFTIAVKPAIKSCLISIEAANLNRSDRQNTLYMIHQNLIGQSMVCLVGRSVESNAE